MQELAKLSQINRLRKVMYCNNKFLSKDIRNYFLNTILGEKLYQDGNG
jgi:hypothetical protein